VTRRRGEIIDKRDEFKRRWPHHVALPVDTLHGAAQSVRIYRLAKELGAPRPYQLERGDSDMMVFCFATAEDAQMFSERFGGELLPAAGSE